MLVKVKHDFLFGGCLPLLILDNMSILFTARSSFRALNNLRFLHLESFGFCTVLLFIDLVNEYFSLDFTDCEI